MASPVRLVDSSAEIRHTREEGVALLHKPTLCPGCRYREQRMAERDARDKRERRRSFRFWFFVVLFLVLAVVSWWRLGLPSALVGLQEGGR